MTVKEDLDDAIQAALDTYDEGNVEVAEAGFMVAICTKSGVPELANGWVHFDLLFAATRDRDTFEREMRAIVNRALAQQC